MEKLGIAVLDGRIAPVFDVARELLLVVVADGSVDYREIILLPATPRERTAKLRDSGIDVLLCGAISNELKSAVEAAGIEVVPFLRGGVCRVLRGWLDKSLDAAEFYMPGCRLQFGRRQRRRRVARGRTRCTRRRGSD